MTQTTTGYVGTVAAAAKLAKLGQRPGAGERVAAIREQMATADRIYADNLAAIRKAADLTQIQMAQDMGVAQSEISRIENRHDMLLSTLAQYLSVAGERPRVVITMNGQEIELDLTQLLAERP
jgi:DNA-binding XRE family transcriptional regulator